MIKFLIAAAIVFIGLFVSAYTFNHINAWIGIFFGIATVGATGYYIKKNL